MATKTNGTHRNGRDRQTDSLAHWLLGALGLLWVGSLTFKSLRERKWTAAETMASRTTPVSVPRTAHVSSQFESKPHRGHERKDANAKWIFGLVLFLLVFGLGLHGILAVFLSALNHTPPPQDGFQPRPSRPAAASAAPSYPLLQVSPAADLEAFRAREQAELDGYGWIDRTSGVVRIPIERAMDLVLAQGLPTRNSTNPPPPGPSSYELIQKRTENRQEEIKP